MKDSEYDSFMKKRKKYYSDFEEGIEKINGLSKEARYWNNKANKIENTLVNSKLIYKEIALEFRNLTILNDRDMSFLFFCVALQCVRCFFQPKVNASFEKIDKEKRHNATQDGNKELSKSKKKAEQAENEGYRKSRQYPDKKKIFLLAVPYDAMEGTKHVVIPGVTTYGKNLYGGNHHSATYGHDPILGYLFGTINILTRTITFRTPIPLTNPVHLHRGSYRQQYVTNNVIDFSKLMSMLVETISQDKTRVIAAIIRQTIHMQSDKYTKDGLPIPFISPEKAQYLLRRGWNSNELERFTKFIGNNFQTIQTQVVLCNTINIIIETLYRLINYEEFESKENVMIFKSKKIIDYSNIIVSTSNIIYSLITKDISNVDFGGLAVTIFRIATDISIIEQIKNEYINEMFEERIE